MKKSLKIRIGGITFVIEEDAYSALELYFESLKSHLKESPEKDEVIHDIEERAGELLKDLLKGMEIVTIDMVNSVIETLGRPEQIADEDSAAPENMGYREQRSKHRLYRDHHNAIIAGVCSGLSAYFNVDPLVFRILFGVLIFAKGFGILLYLIFWIVVPRAETVRQRMEMRGEEINFANLEKNIKNEFEEVKKNMQKHRVSNFFERIFNALGNVFIALGGVLGVVAKVIVAIIAVVFITIGLVGIMASVVSLFMGSIVTTLIPAHSGVTIGQLLATTFDLGSILWVTIPAFLIVVIPFIAFIFVGLRMVFRFRARGSVIFVTSATVWIIAVLMLASVTFLQVRSFTIRESVKETAELTLSESDLNTLRIIADDGFDYSDFNPDKIINIDDYIVAQNGGLTKIVGKPKVFIGKSEGDNFELVVVKRSRGATHLTAKASAIALTQEFSLVGDKLIISPYFYIPHYQKWRIQEVEITINVPEGKSVTIEQNMENLLSNDQEFCLCWPDEMVGNTWTMKGNRLVKK
jgi:phage shock protein PspC (stress-responsive transcriptional regulator)